MVCVASAKGGLYKKAGLLRRTISILKNEKRSKFQIDQRDSVETRTDIAKRSSHSTSRDVKICIGSRVLPRCMGIT